MPFGYGDFYNLPSFTPMSLMQQRTAAMQLGGYDVPQIQPLLNFGRFHPALAAFNNPLNQMIQGVSNRMFGPQFQLGNFLGVYQSPWVNLQHQMYQAQSANIMSQAQAYQDRRVANTIYGVHSALMGSQASYASALNMAESFPGRMLGGFLPGGSMQDMARPIAAMQWSLSRRPEFSGSLARFNLPTTYSESLLREMAGTFFPAGSIDLQATRGFQAGEIGLLAAQLQRRGAIRPSVAEADVARRAAAATRITEGLAGAEGGAGMSSTAREVARADLMAEQASRTIQDYTKILRSFGELIGSPNAPLPQLLDTLNQYTGGVQRFSPQQVRTMVENLRSTAEVTRLTTPEMANLARAGAMQARQRGLDPMVGVRTVQRAALVGEAAERVAGGQPYGISGMNEAVDVATRQQFGFENSQMSNALGAFMGWAEGRGEDDLSPQAKMLRSAIRDRRWDEVVRLAPSQDAIAKVMQTSGVRNPNMMFESISHNKRVAARYNIGATGLQYQARELRRDLTSSIQGFFRDRLEQEGVSAADVVRDISGSRNRAEAIRALTGRGLARGTAEEIAAFTGREIEEITQGNLTEAQFYAIFGTQSREAARQLTGASERVTRMRQIVEDAGIQGSIGQRFVNLFAEMDRGKVSAARRVDLLLGGIDVEASPAARAIANQAGDIITRLKSGDSEIRAQAQKDFMRFAKDRDKGLAAFTEGGALRGQALLAPALERFGAFIGEGTGDVRQAQGRQRFGAMIDALITSSGLTPEEARKFRAETKERLEGLESPEQMTELFEDQQRKLVRRVQYAKDLDEDTKKSIVSDLEEIGGHAPSFIKASGQSAHLDYAKRLRGSFDRKAMIAGGDRNTNKAVNALSQAISDYEAYTKGRHFSSERAESLRQDIISKFKKFTGKGGALSEEELRQMETFTPVTEAQRERAIGLSTAAETLLRTEGAGTRAIEEPDTLKEEMERFGVLEKDFKDVMSETERGALSTRRKKLEEAAENYGKVIKAGTEEEKTRARTELGKARQQYLQTVRQTAGEIGKREEGMGIPPDEASAIDREKRDQAKQLDFWGNIERAGRTEASQTASITGTKEILPPAVRSIVERREQDNARVKSKQIQMVQPSERISRIGPWRVEYESRATRE